MSDGILRVTPRNMSLFQRVMDTDRRALTGEAHHLDTLEEENSSVSCRSGKTLYVSSINDPLSYLRRSLTINPLRYYAACILVNNHDDVR